MTEYVYGMRLRGFAPGCQPMEGLLEWKDATGTKYYDLLVYSRKLTDKECMDYEAAKRTRDFMMRSKNQ